MSHTRAVTLATLATTALALTACGSSSLDSGGSSTSSTSSASSTSAAVDAALVARLPAAVRAKGTITIGVGPNYAPNESLAADGKTVVGMDVDLFDAVAARFGMKTEWVPAEFGSIILGVNSRKYDIGVSSFTINKKREAQANMVSYLSAGTQWATRKGNPDKVDPQNGCGLSIGVQKGTVQVDDLTARSKTCTDAGKKPIQKVVEESQARVTADVVSGKAVAMLADSPVCLYAVKQTNGQLASVGDIYDSAPYGVVLPKTQTDFAQAIADALNAMNADGSYKAALAKWGNESGAIGTFAVNPPASS